MNPQTRRTASQSLLLLGIAAAACGLVSTATEPAPARPTATAHPTTTHATPAPSRSSPFVWTEERHLRDPFRTQLAGVAPPPSPRVDDVALSNTPLDQLRLVAVVGSSSGPTAMVTDPRGFGTALHRGMFVAQAETLDGGPDRGACVVHWRVARIRPSHLRRETDGRVYEVAADVIFERQNPCAGHEVSERSLTMAPAPDAPALQGTFRIAQR